MTVSSRDLPDADGPGFLALNGRVGLGGGLGSALRWWIGRLVGEGYKGRFPVGTFLINISGSLVIGYLSVLFNVNWHNR